MTRSRVRDVASASARAPAKVSCPSGVSDRGETMEMLFRGVLCFEELSWSGRSSFFVAFQE